MKISKQQWQKWASDYASQSADDFAKHAKNLTLEQHIILKAKIEQAALYGIELTATMIKNGADINLALDALEMAFTHEHVNAFALFIHFDAADFRGFQRLCDERLHVGRPRNDVHFFVVQLADNILHTLTAQTDACANRIHFRVA